MAHVCAPYDRPAHCDQSLCPLLTPVHVKSNMFMSTCIIICKRLKYKVFGQIPRRTVGAGF